MDELTSEQAIEPIGHVRVVYLGPVSPHWDVQSDYGAPEVIDAFRDRVLARLVLLPPHDPQFRRNRERVIRDAERENLALEWDLGFPEETEPEEGGAGGAASNGEADTGSRAGGTPGEGSAGTAAAT